MRSILVALPLGLALATVAYAHTGDGSAPVRQAGALVCHTVSNASLVIGTARVATCTFIDENRTFGQAYGAILPPREGDTDAGSQMIVWRVMSAAGLNRPGMLEGAFTGEASGGILRGKGVSLAAIGDTSETSVRLVASDTRFVPGPMRSATRR